MICSSIFVNLELSFYHHFLLARYIRSCKLVTCRRTLFHFMEFQSVVFGFAGSQILFGVNLIICHQILIIINKKNFFLLSFFYNNALYTCCSPFESLAHVSMLKYKRNMNIFFYLLILVSVHSYIFSPYRFPMCLSTIDSISFSSKSFIPYRIRLHSQSAYHI